MVQKFWMSPVFWTAVVTSIAGVLIVATPETKLVVDAIVGALVVIINTAAAANNATNPNGFGANTAE